MAAIRKFLFDTDFTVVGSRRPGDEIEAVETPEDEEVEPAEEETPAPMFSEEDMEVARGQGFAEGKQAGINEAAAAIDRQIAETLDQIGSRLPDLFTAQENAVEELRRQGILMIRALARKVLPGQAERGAMEEIDHMAGLVLERLRSEPSIVFRVNDSLNEAVESRLAEIAAQKGLAGSIKVIGDADIPPGDCRIEWADGGAERRTDALLDEIDQIIARNLGRDADALFAVPSSPESPETAPPDPENGAAPSAATESDGGSPGDEPDEH